MKRLNQAFILSLALIEKTKNEDERESIYEFNSKQTPGLGKDNTYKPTTNAGIMWGNSKEVGGHYIAYCAFDLKYKHSYAQYHGTTGVFEDCAAYKKENEKCARKAGWIIGRLKEHSDLAICPECIARLKEMHKNGEL